MKILEIAFVGYPITDVPRARAFYEQVLGLKPTMEHSGEEGSWIEYDIATGTLAISDMWPPSGAEGPSAALEVDDFDGAIQHLRAHNIPFTFEPTDTPVCRLAAIRDPDGNSLIVHKRKPSS